MGKYDEFENFPTNLIVIMFVNLCIQFTMRKREIYRKITVTLYFSKEITTSSIKYINIISFQLLL